MTVDFDFPEREEEGYSCICTECDCMNEVDYPDTLCAACFFGSHEDG